MQKIVFVCTMFALCWMATGLKAGTCELELENGVVGVWSGECKDGKASGTGSATAPDGGVYKGAAENGKPHGFGTVTKSGGGYFQGEFRNGKPHGWGTARAADGNYYRGEYLDGVRHGDKIRIEGATAGHDPWSDEAGGTETDPWSEKADPWGKVESSETASWGSDDTVPESGWSDPNLARVVEPDSDGEGDSDYTVALTELERRVAEARRKAEQHAREIRRKLEEQAALNEYLRPVETRRSGTGSFGSPTSRSSSSSGFFGSGARSIEDTFGYKALKRMREKTAQENARIRAENSRKQEEYRRRLEERRTQAEATRQQQAERQRQQQAEARARADARRRQEAARSQAAAGKQQEEQRIALQRRQFQQAEIARQRSWIAKSYPCDRRVPSPEGASQIRMLAPKYIMSRTTFGIGACGKSSINESANDFYNKCSFRKRTCTNKGGKFVYDLDFHWKEVVYSCGFTWKLTSNCRLYEPWTFTPSTGRSGSVQ